jgi:hypothetical protein
MLRYEAIVTQIR